MITITEENLEAEDKFYNLGLFSDTQTFFTLPTSMIKSAFELPPWLTRFASIQFNLSREIKENKRTIYGILDFLGDIGGLSDALYLIGSALVNFLEICSGNLLM